MAKLATCPGCTTQLVLPDEATLSDEARCPRCGEEFPLMEAVQFSVPTAELIPADTRSISSEVAEWAAKPLEQNPPEVITRVEDSSSASADEMDRIEAVSNSPERSDAEPSATLSDWEARLKKAISDTEPRDSTEDSTSGKFQLSAGLVPESEIEKSDLLQDFSFPHEDLEPQSEPNPEPAAAPWSAVETDEFDFASSEATVKTTSDATIPSLMASHTPEVEINTSNTSNNSKSRKKKHSLSRTILSASLGVIGIPLGLYALLWIKGPAADVAHLAKLLPQFMLPPSMESPTSRLEDTTEALVMDESEPLPSEDEQAMPPLVADPEVQPATAEEPTYGGPRFELVDREEFGRLLDAAEQAVPELATGKLADETGKRRKGHAYMALCRLADKCSFMNQPGLSAKDAEHTAKAQEIMESTFSSLDVLADLPQIAGPWWEFKSRPSSGIVLTGRVESVENTAAGSIAQVQLGENGTTIPVLVWSFSPRPGEELGFVGSIVNDPSLKIPALSGLSEPIVVAHFSFPIPGSRGGEILSAQPN